MIIVPVLPLYILDSGPHESSAPGNQEGLPVTTAGHHHGLVGAAGLKSPGHSVLLCSPGRGAGSDHRSVFTSRGSRDETELAGLTWLLWRRPRNEDGGERSIVRLAVRQPGTATSHQHTGNI